MLTYTDLWTFIDNYNNSHLGEVFNPSEETLERLLKCLNRIRDLGDRTMEEAFASGCGRFQNDADFFNYYNSNPVYQKPDGTLYVIPKDELEIMYQECGTDHNALEFLTGVEQGKLEDGYVIIEVDKMDGITVTKPTGNEFATNAAYNPNGLPGGTKEGIVKGLPNPVQNGTGHNYYCTLEGDRADIDICADGIETIVEEEEEEESEENGTVEVETEVKVEEKTTVEETEDSVTVTSETTTTTTTTTTENKEEDDGMDDA